MIVKIEKCNIKIVFFSTNNEEHATFLSLKV